MLLRSDSPRQSRCLWPCHRWLATLSTFLALTFSLFAQQAAPVSLRGTVRDATGKAVAGALVQLRGNDSAQSFATGADEQGSYSFVALKSGLYTLHVSKNGYEDANIASVFLTPSNAQNVDVTLAFSKNDPAKSSSTAPQFFDPPQFVVAGVTDTTNLGGHGSDAIVRTRDALAKETAGLGKAADSPPTGLATREKMLREKVEREPSDFDANRQLGELLLETGRARQAIEFLERAGAANPTDYKNAFDLALANADAGNYQAARDKARSLLTTQDKSEVHHLLGDVEEKLGDPLAAVSEYQRAAEMDPKESYLFDWGSELLLHHAPEPALEVFNRGQKLFPSSVRLMIGSGAALFARGSDDEAVRKVCDASDLNPNDLVPYLFLGKMLAAEVAPSAELVEKLHRFAALQPQSADANYYYAAALWKAGKNAPDPARTALVESLLQRAIDLDPKSAAAHLDLGIVRTGQADYSRAIAEYQQAARIDPQMAEAHYRMSQAYRQLGNTAQAQEELQVYERLTKETSEKMDRERHDIKQFVYRLRDQAPQSR